MKLAVFLTILFGTLILACSNTAPAPSEPTPNIDATVEAKLSQEPGVDSIATPPPTPNIDATVEAKLSQEPGVDATATPPTPNIDATVEAKLSQEPGVDATTTPPQAISSTHVIVELSVAPEGNAKADWAARGLNLLGPIDEHLWYASVNAGDIGALEVLQGVVRIDPIEPKDKLAGPLQQPTEPFFYQLRPGGRIAYSVLFHRDVTAEEVQGLSSQLDIKFEDFSPIAFPIVRAVTVNVPIGELEALSKVDIISRIEPAVPPVQDENGISQAVSNVNVVQLPPLGLDGSGITVGVWEAGDVIYAAHEDLQPRVIVQPGQTSSVDDHAAHVAGTIGGSGVFVPNAEGMAPQVTILSWDTEDVFIEMASAAASPTPIQVSNHSYGFGIGWDNLLPPQQFTNNQSLFGAYQNNSWTLDNLVATTGLIVVKSAGNHRDDVPASPVNNQPGDCLQGLLTIAADCIDYQAAAKNIITVGAMNGSNSIASFSSYGPTDDGRIKPDLMAHGVNVTSLASTGPQASTIKSGTSMAAPVVSGIVSLVLQQANSLNITITPAGMKSLLIQTAEDVQGIDQSTEGPDYATGWGIVDAQAAVDLLQQGGLVQATLSGTGISNTWVQTFDVPAGETEVHVTLAWDDPPPSALSFAQPLVNDLDLRLIAPNGTQFKPWILGGAANPGQPAWRDGGNDSVNNVEQVSVLAPAPGIWTVQVSANLGNLPFGPQTFAVAGASSQPCPPLSIDAPTTFQASDGAHTNKVALGWDLPLVIEPVVEWPYQNSLFVAEAPFEIDSSGILHVVYRSTFETTASLVHTWKVPGNCWASEVLPEGGHSLALAIDSDDTLHLSYTRFDQVVHAWKLASGVWQTEIVASEAGYYKDIALDANGGIHIAYVLGGDIRYASNTTGFNPSLTPWIIETVVPDVSFANAEQVALVVSSAGNVHVVYQWHTISAGGLTYVWKPAAGSWSYQAIDVGSYRGYHPDLSFKGPCIMPAINPVPGDCLMVTYYDMDNQQLKYAQKGHTGNWTVEVVDSPGNYAGSMTQGIGPFPFMVIGSVHIAYYDFATQQLKHAWKHNWNGSWTTEILDSVVISGMIPKVAINSSGVHITYFSNPSSAILKHAFYPTDATFNIWRRDTVGGLGVGSWSNLGSSTSTAYDDTSAIQEIVYEYAVEAEYSSVISPQTTDTGFATSWIIETIDTSTNDVGKFTSMAYGGGDQFHISYYDDTDNDLLYRLYSTTGPGFVERVAQAGNVGQYTSIALDPTSPYKHIAYRIAHPGSDLGHAWEGGAPGWTLSVPDGPDGVGLYTSVAIDGYVHIAYYDATNNALKHAWTGSTWGGPPWNWFVEVVDSNGNAGQDTSIAVAPDDSLHISYFIPSPPGTVRHAWGVRDAANNTWQWTITDVGSNAGGYTSLALDSNGYPHITYTRGSGLEHAWATWNSATLAWEWDTEQIDSRGQSSSLTIDANDGLHVAYYDSPDDALKYASGMYDSGTGMWLWETQIVDDPAGENVGQFTAIAVHDSGSIYIAYYDATNGDLKLAHN